MASGVYCGAAQSIAKGSLVNNYEFGRSSTTAFLTLHPAVQGVMCEALRTTFYDFSIIWGYRGPDAQALAFRMGNSKRKYPNSVHNKMPSLAVDVAPYPLRWKETHIFAHLAGVIAVCAHDAGLGVRWGADWNGDGRTDDQRLMDYGHHEFTIPPDWERT